MIFSGFALIKPKLHSSVETYVRFFTFHFQLFGQEADDVFEATFTLFIYVFKSYVMHEPDL